MVSPGAHNLRFIDAVDRTGLYTVKVGDFFIIGVYGEISHFLSDPTEILFLVI